MLDLNGRVAHTLRLKGVVPLPVIVAALNAGRGTRPTVEAINATLDELAADGYARRWNGSLAGWKLTDAGRAHGEEILASELEETQSRPTVEQVYGTFLPLNGAFLQLCTDWQVRTTEGARVINDHLDAEYDAAVIHRLHQAHDGVGPLLAQLATRLGRFSSYKERFANALENVESGGQDWFTKPGIDSYHTVWFELHEDLLATLGRDRSGEHEAN